MRHLTQTSVLMHAVPVQPWSGRRGQQHCECGGRRHLQVLQDSREQLEAVDQPLGQAGPPKLHGPCLAG